ncbi:MAG: hypothetical protein JST68_21605 [Bacteroidetes bacterium]|nr:hypothetical protein [Bacteroidota bacterium]
MIALCDTIESNTGVIISLSTIKRLLNGQFARIPQIATLNAIALSSGYKDWRDFTQAKALLEHARPEDKQNLDGPEQRPGSQQNPTGLEQNPGSPQPGPKPYSIPRFLIAGAVIILALLGTLAILMSHKPGPANIDKAYFSATKTTGNDIPNTVIFKYNVDSVSADSFFIQQSWDRNRRVQVYKHNYTLTDIYYEPGYHTAKLIAGDKIIRTLPVSIPTDRWLFYTIENKPGSRPKYITHRDTGMLKLSTDELLANNINLQNDNVYCNTWFPSDIDYSSDNFTLKCRVRIKPVNNESCPLLMCEVYCQKYFMYFKSTLKGCTGMLTAQFGENELNGRTNDLSGLGADLREWQDMEFTVRDKKVSIVINGKHTYSNAYTQSAGLITGLGFISNGISEVQFVDLKTADGRIIYSREKNSH